MLKEYTKEHRIVKIKDNQLNTLNDNTIVNIEQKKQLINQGKGVDSYGI